MQIDTSALIVRTLEFKHMQIDTSALIVEHDYTFNPGAFVRGINEILILIRQPHFNVHKGLPNE